MKIDKSWHMRYTHAGHEISADSNNEYLYLTIKNETYKDGNCVAITYDQLESLELFIRDTIDHLKEEGHWDPKKTKETK